MSSLASKLHAPIFCILEVIKKCNILKPLTFSSITVSRFIETWPLGRWTDATQPMKIWTTALQRAANSNYKKLFQSAFASFSITNKLNWAKVYLWNFQLFLHFLYRLQNQNQHHTYVVTLSVDDRILI